MSKLITSKSYSRKVIMSTVNMPKVKMSTGRNVDNHNVEIFHIVRAVTATAAGLYESIHLRGAKVTVQAHVFIDHA